MKTTISLVAMGLALLVALAPAALAGPVYTGTIKQGVYQKPNPTTPGVNTDGKGRQQWGRAGRPDGTLGLDFRVTVAEGITVTSLGVWDDNGDGLLTAHTIRLWDLSDPSTPLAEVNTLPGTGRLDATGWYRYFDIDPLVIADGTEFAVSVYYPSVPATVVDSNGNSGAPSFDLEPTPTFNSISDSLKNIGGARYGFGNGFPLYPDTGPANRYHAGSFEYTPNPEPGTMALLGGVLAVAGVVRRRRRRRAQRAA